MKRLPVIAVLLFQSIFWIGGCNPVSSAVQYGVHLVGKEVDDKDTQKLGRELIGQDASAADEKFGKRDDILGDVNSSREWLVYPTKFGALEKHMYVVEINNGRIVAISKTETEQGQLDLPRKIVLEGKARGKSPRQCQAELGMGSPLITVRSEKTGSISQFYDARVLEGSRNQKYCVLRFDTKHKCCSVKLVEVMASTKRGLVY